MSEMGSASVISQKDCDNYMDELLQRYRNVHIKHKTSQIACDGSKKLEQRLLRNMKLLLLVGKQ